MRQARKKTPRVKTKVSPRPQKASPRKRVVKEQAAKEATKEAAKEAKPRHIPPWWRKGGGKTPPMEKKRGRERSISPDRNVRYQQQSLEVKQKRSRSRSKSPNRSVRQKEKTYIEPQHRKREQREYQQESTTSQKKGRNPHYQGNQNEGTWFYDRQQEERNEEAANSNLCWMMYL